MSHSLVMVVVLQSLRLTAFAFNANRTAQNCDWQSTDNREMCVSNGCCLLCAPLNSNSGSATRRINNVHTCLLLLPKVDFIDEMLA